jgi:LPS sulfotransferase NodH
MVRFVILAAPRTGSNWLCTLLDSHPEILCHHEIFNPDGIHCALSQRGGRLDLGTVQDRERDPMGVLQRVWEEGLGFAAVGFKMTRGQDARVLEHVLADPGVRKIILKRRNRIRTFVSERIAETTGEWESYPDRYEDRDLGKGRVRVRVEVTDLDRHRALNEQYYDGICRSLAASGQPFLELRYERLGFDQERRRVLGFLGVSSDPTGLKAGTRKQNAAALPELIANFDELRARLRGSDLEPDLYARDVCAAVSGDRDGSPR